MSPIISVSNLSKTYGSGFKALKGINLDINRGEIFALLGPNGAGKTTLISQLTGHLEPHGGSVALAGSDITYLPAHRRCALGLARSFQITSLLLDFTAADNVALAAQAHAGHSFRFFANARKERGL
uniref:ATP-binding cassette domain-containing protein n=1 Tax=uncultured Bradyrhizobium sp. TaxID=199684 RepID=UPI002616C83D